MSSSEATDVLLLQVMMGICADDAFEGVAALKEWVGALELPRCGCAKCT